MDQGLLRRIEKDILLLDPNAEDMMLQDAPIAGRIIKVIEVTADSPDSEDHSDPLPGGPELLPRSSSGNNDQ